MRTVDLAVYADSLAAEAASLAARLERARGRLRQAAIEREAREVLPVEVVARLRRLGLLRTAAESETMGELEELQRSRAAVQQLQAWVEAVLERETRIRVSQPAATETADGRESAPSRSGPPDRAAA